MGILAGRIDITDTAWYLAWGLEQRSWGTKASLVRDVGFSGISYLALSSANTCDTRRSCRLGRVSEALLYLRYCT